MTTPAQRTNGNGPDEDSFACDVLVIGGGPAGSAIATHLARRGREVVVLEKAHHPREHIGESLLPYSMPYLAELDVLEEVNRSIGILKRGADFFSDHDPKPHQTYYFRNAWEGDSAHAYEVDRSDFDKLLFHNAAQAGAQTHEGMRVIGVEFHPGGHSRVIARDENGNERVWDARFVVDASGRDTFLSSRFKLKQKNRKHASSALYGYYKNVPRQPDEDEGNICLYWLPHGWVWLIPLRNGLMSVGAVCFPDYLKTRDCPPAEFLDKTLALSPMLAERMKGAERVGKVQATGNFSYFSRRASGKGYLLVGDAFAFLDPVFSSGVHIALTSASLGADTVDGILDNPARARRLTRAYERNLRRGLRRFAWFIYRFNAPAFRRMFMDPGMRFGMFEAVTAMLAGDVFRPGPPKRPILLFRAAYYLVSLIELRGSIANWRRRRRSVAGRRGSADLERAVR
ncbi:MAG: NAD(P)/FAD-dependent oxidoreductase [Gammaproteobacteria bacterium]